MSKSIEEYLKILYPNIDSLNEEEQQRFEKDKAFLLRFLDEINKEYNDSIFLLDKYGESNYTKNVFEACKKRLDEETTIINYVEDMTELLNKNSYISNNFDAFMNIMYYERAQGEQFKNQTINKTINQTPIELENVFELTAAFLSQIDDSGKLLSEFKDLQKQGNIIVDSTSGFESGKSNHKNGVIIYYFDGTIDSARYLIHEFMHYWTYKTSNLTQHYEERTMLNEYESIYYENAFIEFLDIDNSVKQALKVFRSKEHYDNDPYNQKLMLLELCQKFKNERQISKNDIIETLRKYIPGIENEDELWKIGSEILTQPEKKLIFPSHMVKSIMYNFNTGLALQTEYTPEMLKNNFKLSTLLEDTYHDDKFMEQYFIMTNRTDKTFSDFTIEYGNKKITPSEIFKNALKGTPAYKVKEAADIEASYKEKKESDTPSITDKQETLDEHF